MTDTIGNRISDPYRGMLVFDYLPPDLQRAEDSRHDADLSFSDSEGITHWWRPATDAERTLLAHLGFTVPEQLSTYCERVTHSIVQRRWPDIEASAQLPQGNSS